MAIRNYDSDYDPYAEDNTEGIIIAARDKFNEENDPFEKYLNEVDARYLEGQEEQVAAGIKKPEGSITRWVPQFLDKLKQTPVAYIDSSIADLENAPDPARMFDPVTDDDAYETLSKMNGPTIMNIYEGGNIVDTVKRMLEESRNVDTVYNNLIGDDRAKVDEILQNSGIEITDDMKKKAIIQVAEENRLNALEHLINAREREFYKGNPELAQYGTGWQGEVEQVFGEAGRNLDTLVLAALPITRPIAPFAMYSKIKGGLYADIKTALQQKFPDKDADWIEERAYQAATTASFAEAIPESLGRFATLRGLSKGRGPFTKRLLGMFGAAGVEGATELIQQFPEEFAMYWALNPDLDDLSLVRQFKTFWNEKGPEAVRRSIEAGKLGFELGLFYSAPANVIGTIRDLRDPVQAKIRSRYEDLSKEDKKRIQDIKVNMSVLRTEEGENKFEISELEKEMADLLGVGEETTATRTQAPGEPIEISERTMKGLERLEKAAAKEPGKPYPIHYDVEAKSFAKATKENFRWWMLTQNDPAKLHQMVKDGEVSLYQMPGRNAGYGISKDGELLFFHSNEAPNTGVGRTMIEDAIAKGATKLMVFDQHTMPEFYKQFGFEEVGREKFNDEFAPPGWNYEELGRPDVVYMELKRPSTTGINEANRTTLKGLGYSDEDISGFNKEQTDFIIKNNTPKAAMPKGFNMPMGKGGMSKADRKRLQTLKKRKAALKERAEKGGDFFKKFQDIIDSKTKGFNEQTKGWARIFMTGDDLANEIGIIDQIHEARENQRLFEIEEAEKLGKKLQKGPQDFNDLLTAIGIPEDRATILTEVFDGLATSFENEGLLSKNAFFSYWAGEIDEASALDRIGDKVVEKLIKGQPLPKDQIEMIRELGEEVLAYFSGLRLIFGMPRVIRMVNVADQINTLDDIITHFGEEAIPPEGYLKQFIEEGGDIRSYIVSHEMGHMLTDLLRVYSPNAYAELAGYFGMNPNEPMLLWYKKGVPQQEQVPEIIADSFARYIHSGKAPTTALQKAFAKMKEWLDIVLSKLLFFVEGPGKAQGDPNLYPFFDKMFQGKTTSEAVLQQAAEYQGMFSPNINPEMAAGKGTRIDEIRARQDRIDEIRARQDELRARSEEIMNESNALNREYKGIVEKMMTPGDKRLHTKLDEEFEAFADDLKKAVGFNEKIAKPTFEEIKGETTILDEDNNVLTTPIDVEPGFNFRVRNIDGMKSAEDIDNFIRSAGKVVEAAGTPKLEWDDVRDIAANLGMKEDAVRNVREGDRYTQAELVAADQIKTYAAKRVAALADLAAAGGEGDMWRFQKAVAQFDAISKTISGFGDDANTDLKAFELEAASEEEAVLKAMDRLKEYDNAGIDITMTVELIAGLKNQTPTQIIEFLDRRQSVGFGDMLVELWINSLLSGPQTHVVNMTSNAMTAFFSPFELGMAAVFNKIRKGAKYYSPISEQEINDASEGKFVDHAFDEERLLKEDITFREAGLAFYGFGRGLVNGFKLLADALPLTGDKAKRWYGNMMSGESNPLVGHLSKYENYGRRKITAANVRSQWWGELMAAVPDAVKLGKAFDIMVNFFGEVATAPSTALKYGDAFFTEAVGYQTHLHSAAARQAIAEGYKGRALIKRVQTLTNNAEKYFPHLVDMARKGAAYTTFTNKLGKTGRDMQRAIENNKLYKFAFPFIRTPTNIAKYTIDHTPLKLLSVFSSTSDLRAGGAQTDLALARMAFGTVFMTLAGFAYLNGNITGGGPDDPELYKLKRASGWQPYSIRTKDGYVSLSRLEPWGSLLAMGADFVDIMRELGDSEDSFKDDIAELAAGLVTTFGKNITSKTWVKGAAEIADVMRDADRYGERYINRFAGSFIPSVLAQITRTTDKEVKEIKDYIAAIKARLPGYSEDVPARRNIFGEKIMLSGSWGPDWASPFYYSQDRNSVAVDEMLRLELRKDLPPTSINIQGVRIDLDPHEYEFYMESIRTAKIEGSRTLLGALESLVKTAKYKGMSDRSKIKVINRYFGSAHDQAKADLGQLRSVQLKINAARKIRR